VDRGGAEDAGSGLRSLAALSQFGLVQRRCVARSQDRGGTTGADWADENLPSATKKRLSTIIDAMSGVQSGLYDAVVCDLPVSRYQIKMSYSDLEIIEEIPTGEQYGIAISKDNPGLTAAINAALAEMQEDGSMAAIEAEWFGSEL
jgi:polar amino acid transport system substrate-binding protein